jgi:histidyl-tRNA synthetase
MTERKIYKPKAISGFPEWLPEYRAVEQAWMDHIRRVFESYGYCNIETPAVEELEVLGAKGEVDKEIYVLERLHKDENDKSEARLGLHFDQTVPFARYVAQHFSALTFPFKRYQMQKVWRGERPQLGRMREFYQCDIDVIGIDNLPLHFDAEMPAVIYECLMGLGIGRVQIRISNRKILLGLLSAMTIIESAHQTLVLREIDKLEKIGSDNVCQALTDLQKIHNLNLDQRKIDWLLGIATIKATAKQSLLSDPKIVEIYSINEQIKEGIDELSFVMSQLAHLPDYAAVADLSIIRGLDYYTGTVYEAKLLDIPEFTSTVIAGGRYDDLAGSYINKHLPGVGISIGLSRLFDVLKAKGIVQPGPKTPTEILVVLPSEEQRGDAAAAAQTLRARGTNVELFHKPAKTGDQIQYALKKGIPFVWFIPSPDKPTHSIKNLATQEQSDADPATWIKPQAS